jgi:hypothetical protein
LLLERRAASSTPACTVCVLQVLLALYATVAERMGAEAQGDEAGAGGGASSRQLDLAALEEETALSSALAQLADEQHGALAAEDPALAQLAQLAAQHAAVAAAMREAAEAAEAVRVSAELHQRLLDFDAAAAAGSYTEAAWIALELQKAAAAVPGAADTAAAVEARVQPLQDHLLTTIYGCCTIDPNSRMPVLIPAAAAEQGQAGAGGGGGGADSTAASAAVLAEVWAALRVLGLLPAALQQLAAFFLEHSVQPILASGGSMWVQHHSSWKADEQAGGHQALMRAMKHAGFP